jgi:membrane fusion protein (multidrug efflux system)
MIFRLPAVLGLIAVPLLWTAASAQMPPSGPPGVGVVRVEKEPVTQTSEYVARIQAINRVALVARVTAFIEQQKFLEGSEVKKGDLLYVLEQPPFQADLAAKQAAVQQAEAQLQNAKLTYDRSMSLLRTPAGQQSAVDNARATMLADAAQVQANQAQAKQSAINLGYTEIRAPVDGKIGRTAVTVGNVVSPGSGTLTTIVSQDPMYVVIPVPMRAALDLGKQYARKGGFNSVVVRLRLGDGRIYPETGQLTFVDNTVSQSTDTLILRATIANPIVSRAKTGQDALRGLIDDEFVTALIESAEPVELVSIPRAAVLSDQRGDYVFTVAAGNKVQETRVTLGQSTATIARVLTGLKVGETVIVDGLQKVHPGQVVAPGPASPMPGMGGDGRSALATPAGGPGGKVAQAQ